MVVSDIGAARDGLLGCGVEISDVFHGAGDVYAGKGEPYLFGRVRISGPDPGHSVHAPGQSLSNFLEQPVIAVGIAERGEHLRRRLSTHRRCDVRRWHTASTKSASARRTRMNWPDWYAEYIIREQGKPLLS